MACTSVSACQRQDDSEGGSEVGKRGPEEVGKVKASRCVIGGDTRARGLVREGAKVGSLR